MKKLEPERFETPVDFNGWRELYPPMVYQVDKSKRFEVNLDERIQFDFKRVKCFYDIQAMGYDAIMLNVRDATVKNGMYAFSRFLDFYEWCRLHVDNIEEHWPAPHLLKRVEIVQVFLIWCYMIGKYAISTIRNTFKTGLGFYFNYMGWNYGSENLQRWAPMLNTTVSTLLMKFGHVEYKVEPVLNTHLWQMIGFADLTNETDAKRIATIANIRYFDIETLHRQRHMLVIVIFQLKLIRN